MLFPKNELGFIIYTYFLLILHNKLLMIVGAIIVFTLKKKFFS